MKKMKGLKKLLFLCSCFGFLLSSCSYEDDEYEWWPDPQVYSIRLQYNNKNIDGQFEADISMGTVAFTAKIVKDQGSTFQKVFASSNQTVAEIDQTGLTTLKSEGESIISVSAGGKSHEIVLIVTNKYATFETYDISISGGHAVDLEGNTVTSARQYTYLTLVPDVPVHKGFIDWNFSVEDVWQSGNAIKMPGEDLVVTANYADELYKLTLVGAEVIRAGEEENPLMDQIIPAVSQYDVKNIYTFAYGTEVTIKALTPPANKIFVGFDYNNIEDNRIGNEGIDELTFNMSDEESTYKSVYSTVSNNALLYDANSKFTFSGATISKIQDSSDPELKGYTGYSMTFSGNISPTKTGYTENITRSNIDTLTTFNPLTIEVLFKNESTNLDVNVELYLSYFGNLATTGVVMVPANSVVRAIMHANICIPAACSWGFAIRDNIDGGTSSDSITLKFVAGSAKTYPNGYPLTKVGENYETLNFGTTGQNNGTSLKSSSGWTAPGRFQMYDRVSGIFWSAYCSSFASQNEYIYTKVTNMPEYNPDDPNCEIYVKGLNNVNNTDEPINEFTLYFLQIPAGTSESTAAAFNPKAENAVIAGQLHIKIEKIAEVFLGKVDIIRTNASDSIYIVIAKDHIEGTDRYAFNMFMQFTFNNVFGYIDE